MKNKISCSAVFVAGGTGSRMGTDIKKQFLLLENEPILIHTVKNISLSEFVDEIIVVAPEDNLDATKEMLKNFIKVKNVVKGGKTRAESVKSVIDVTSDCDIIIVHDGVRPFIKKEILENCILDAV